MKAVKLARTIGILLYIAIILPTAVFAQSISSVAVNREINDTVSAGDIISLASDGSFKRSTTAYDTQIVGVVVDTPIISTEPKTDKTKAVASNGEAQVKVTGNIAVGDFLTSSTTAGAAQKATDSGQVLGKALSAGNGGLVSVQIEIGSRQVGAGSGKALGFFQSIAADKSKLRLTLAAILAAVVLLGCVVAFIRLVVNGVTAMGRNPLARTQIMRSMFVSGFVVVLVMALGFGAVAAIIFLGPK